MCCPETWTTRSVRSMSGCQRLQKRETNSVDSPDLDVRVAREPRKSSGGASLEVDTGQG